MAVLSDPHGISQASAQQLLAELINIPSINPAYDPGSRGETELATAVARLCEEFGASVEMHHVLDDRHNLYVRLGATHSRKTLLIEAHLDTVGLPSEKTSESRWDMAAAQVDGTRMYGRGACDVKGALTAALLAMRELAKSPLANLDVVLLGAIDEEYQFRGISHYIAERTALGALPDSAIVLEPTELGVVHEHHGVLRAEIQVAGLAAHTSRPLEGKNAIVDSLRVVEHLESWNADSGGRVLAVTTIRGGTAINIIPDQCTFGIDLRVLPAEDPRDVLKELQQELQRVNATGTNASISNELLLDGGMSTPADADIVRAAVSALGEGATPRRVTFGTDGSKLSRVGVPTIVFGPGSIEQAHADDEWVEIPDVVTAANHILVMARNLDALSAADADHQDLAQ